MPKVSEWFEKGSVSLLLAPMAGFTDSAFRQLCKLHGADALVSEFVMANAVLEAGPLSRIWKILSFHESQRPMGLQLFGAEPDLMASAARRLEELMHPDFIDINCGCPSPKIVGQMAGSALLKDLPLAARIAGAVVRAVPCTPVTAKIRTGWDETSVVALEAARMLEDAGIAALTVHGRTRRQGYSGDADWGLIAQVAASVKIPVVGNGSVGGGYPADVIRRSGVAGVMIGRAALGNPWIFQRMRCELAGLPPPEPPTQNERLQTMLDYARDLLAGDDYFPALRAKLKPFTQDIPGARKLRNEMDAAKSIGELEELIS